MADTTMVPKTLDKHSQSSLFSKGKYFSNNTRFSTTPSGGKQNVTTSVQVSFRKTILTEGPSEKAIYFISDARRSGAVNHYELSWRKWDDWC